MTPRHLVMMISGIILALLVLIIAAMSYFTVPQYASAVVTSWGKYNYTAGPGFHLKVPVRDNVREYRTDIQSLSPDKGVNIYTIDNQEVDVVFTVFYRIPPENVEYIYQNVQDYRPRLYSMAVDRLKAEMGKTNVQTLAGKRGEIRDTIKGVLQSSAKALGLNITDFQLTDLQYAPSFRAAVASAANAKAMIETKENERLQAEKVAETAKIKAQGEANAVREAARGKADATLLQAQADAKGIQLRGEATATAMKAQAEALKQNPVLVEMRKAENWNGQLPAAVYAGAPIPFMQIAK